MQNKGENRIFLILLIISLTIVSLNSQGYKNILNIKKVIYFVYIEAYNFIEHQTNKIEEFFQSNRIHKQTFIDNIELKKEIIKLRNQNIRLKNIIINNGLKLPEEKRINIARIISWDIYAPYETLMINKGFIDNIKENDVVINLRGELVGKIIFPISPHSAKVLLISSSKFRAGVKIGNKNELGIFFGTGKDTGIVKYIRKTSKILKGDIVKTSGLDTLFPENIVIGKVKKIDKSYYYLNVTVSINFFKNINRYLGIYKR